MASSQFPKDFYWGAATSSHQVEGGNHNDWSEWEIKHAARLSRESGGAYSPENYISGRACDHYNRYEEDFDYAKELGHNAHRFSIEWSRIEPEEGKFIEKEIEHYHAVIRALRERGIEPFVTLWHWTLPLWLRDKGGAAASDFPELFARYARRMAEEYKDDVQFWITINEPYIYAGHAYLQGSWPPQKKNIIAYMQVINKLVCAHKAAYAGILRACSTAQIGISKHNIYFEAAGNRVVNMILKRLADWWWNEYFLRRIRSHQHFIGLNHYLHNRIDYGFGKNENKEVSDMGWELYPESLYRVLLDLRDYKKPIYITENGIADAGDTKRAAFITDHISWMQKAMNDGVDVRGYFYWSLVDNFEWDKGFWPRFGLVAVDYRTQMRTIRKSAWEYARIVKGNRA